MKSILAFAVLTYIAYSEATVCHTNVDCSSDECCFIQPEFMVMSKRRQLILPQPHNPRDTGVCEKYRSPGSICDTFEVLNKHCGCTTGYSCQWVPDPTVSVVTDKLLQVVQRSMIYHPEPGSYKCAPTR